MHWIEVHVLGTLLNDAKVTKPARAEDKTIDPCMYIYIHT